MIALLLATVALYPILQIPPDDQYLQCYQRVAEEPRWSAQGPARLGRNETFALAVMDGCSEHIERFRAPARERAIAMLKKSGKDSDAQLVELGTKFVLVRGILADWPEVQKRMTKAP